MMNVSDRLATGAGMEPRVMTGFQYQHGDQPLDGYTIQRALGRGGFGEVYYALSDSGRQVALKAVQGYEQIELRGVQQCMNLKSPHLVTIFDVRYNDRGRPFVIMEYVAGPSLRELLDDAPQGLGPQKAAYFLREIAKGLTFLHDCGIVHRDLKPGNIFYEDGYVKIGDYGLSKAMSPTQHSGQTVTVGTVHYMAPEIGEGRYDRSIDIYALGIVLYEMLTGRPPYEGSSISEILMKHMSGRPDLTGIDEPFASAIRRATDRDPARRFATVQEMVEAVFGAERIRSSVSVFSPDSLSVVAGRAARDIAPDSSNSAAAPPQAKPRTLGGQIHRAATHLGREIRAQVGEVVADVREARPAQADPLNRPPTKLAAGQLMKPEAPPAPRVDPMSRSQRRWLTVIAIGVAAIATGLIGSDGRGPLGQPDEAAVLAALMMVGGVLGSAIARTRLELTGESKLMWRLGFGGLACILSMVGAMVWASNYRSVRGSDDFTGILLAVSIGLFLLNWRKVASPGRKTRVSIDHLVIAGVHGMWLAFLFDGLWLMAVGILAGIALAAQLLAPLGAVGKATPAAPPVASPASRATALYVSPCKRLWAFLLGMGWFMGFAGLHRFYVGKIFTGCLWFITWGLFGIGQLIDVILILTGQFTDRLGRPLLAWENLDEIGAAARPKTGHPATQPPAGAPPQPVPARPTATGGTAGMILSGLGGLLMLAAVLIGLAVATNLPAIVAAGVTDPSLARELQRELGSGWEELLNHLGLLAGVVVMLLAAVVMVFARREAGFAAMLRAAVGAFGLLMTVYAVRASLAGVDWSGVAAVFQRGVVAPAINAMLAQASRSPAILAAVLLVASVIVLCWPSRRRPVTVPPEQGA